MKTREQRIREFQDTVLPQYASDLLYSCLSSRINDAGEAYIYFTLKTIQDNIKANWNWHDLAINPCLTLEFITEHMDDFKTGCWTGYILYFMAAYTGIDKDIIATMFRLDKKYCDQPVVPFYRGSYYQYNMILKAHGSPTRLAKLCMTTFSSKPLPLYEAGHGYLICIDMAYRMYMAAYKIQQWWIGIITNPYHPIGKKRIEREYDRLVSEKS